MTVPVTPRPSGHRPRVRALLTAVLTPLLAVVVGLGALTVAAPQAHAAGTGYVALGDSFSSGLGTRDYYADGTECARSPKSYAALVAASNGLDLTLAACSAAVTADVLRDQIPRITGSTAYVSVSIGGNDVGFADVLTECAKPGWASDCDGAIDDGLAILRGPLAGRIDSVLDGIAGRAPNAEVVLVGYPRLFMGEDCNALTWFSPEEQDRLNAATDELAALLAARARAAGVGFVDPRSSFTGHAVCDDPEWINGLSKPVSESYHPNAAGYRSYAALVGPALTGAGSALRTDARLTQGEVALPDAYAVNGPFTFEVPDVEKLRAQQR